MSFSWSRCHQGLKTAPEGEAFKRCRNLSSCRRDIIESKCKRKRNARAARSGNLQTIFGQYVTAPTDYLGRSARPVCVEKHFRAYFGASTEREKLRNQLSA